MKSKILRTFTLSFAPACLLALTSCWTPPTHLAALQGNPGLVGAWVTVAADQFTAKVDSVDVAQRKVVLLLGNGTKVPYKAGPNVADLNELKAGDKLKIKVAQEIDIFLVKNGPPPSAGVGVTVDAAPDAAVPTGVVLETTNTTAKVIGVDRSYRLLTLLYADGTKKIIKLPLPNTLKIVEKGDDIVLRTTERMILQVKKK